MLLLWAIPVCLVLSLAAGVASAAATPIEVSLSGAGDAVKVSISLPPEGAPDVLVFPPPRPRVAVDLPRAPIRVAGAAAASMGEAVGLGPVSRVRFAERERGLSRIVLDLAPGAALTERRTIAERGRARLELTVVAQASAATEPASEPRRASHPRPRVVVDAGHGGRDSGAIGAGGAYEKDVTLAAALELRDLLEARGVDVILTREKDVFLTLFERLNVAREANADLFLSLHADASADPAVSGASVYTLSTRGEARARSAAEAQNWELDLPAKPGTRAAGDILFDLAQRRTRSRSEDFADLLVAELAPVTPLLRNTHRTAGFAVLLAPDVPAALLELGFMTSRADEARLTDPKRRRALLNEVADAVSTFLAPSVTFAQR